MVLDELEAVLRRRVQIEIEVGERNDRLGMLIEVARQCFVNVPLRLTRIAGYGPFGASVS